MPRPRVAIVGSLDARREFDPPLSDPDGASRAGAELGQALAEAGWDIMVYSADAAFIEAEVVQGYASVAPAQPGSIQVHAPMGMKSFAEFDQHPELFDVRADPSGDWEVAFYRTLAHCDGVLVIGGGRSTLVAGLIALTLRVPILAVATFGGNARKVWERLAAERGDATDEDVNEMARVWREGSAQRLVQCLQRQADARGTRQREQEQQAGKARRRANLGLASAAVLLLAAVAVLTLAWSWRPGTGGSVALLALAPVLTGAAGALIRTSIDAGHAWARAGVLGGAAGLVTGLLYVASQLIGTPALLEAGQADSMRRLLFFVLPMGFIAGLTFDAVYAKLQKVDASQTKTLDQG